MPLKEEAFSFLEEVLAHGVDLWRSIETSEVYSLSPISIGAGPTRCRDERFKWDMDMFAMEILWQPRKKEIEHVFPGRYRWKAAYCRDIYGYLMLSWGYPPFSDKHKCPRQRIHWYVQVPNIFIWDEFRVMFTSPTVLWAQMAIHS